jgi:PQQ-dependent dehydrogenase (methanol/ethanol family)
MTTLRFAWRRTVCLPALTALSALCALWAHPAAQAQAPSASAPELTEQQRLRAQSPGGGLTPGVELPNWAGSANRLDRSSPVTDAMLTNPSPNDWLSWRGTRDGLGFSPLSSIDKRNVGTLQLAWSLSLPAGPNTATPLVHDGVIYVHSFGDHVQALDGATGDELWHYARELPSTFRPTVKRNMALYGDKLYVGTSDVHVVALDVKTGAVVWDTPIAAEGSGFGLSGGPLVARGKVMQGINGQAPGGAYIVALDAESGEEAWRFYSIARPGEPGGESWNGLPVDKRTGGSVWTAGSYDAERNLAFFGPAPTYDTGPLRDSIAKRGISNDALYTNSTIALDPDTGKLVWHFQHVPNDQWDFDWAFERQIVTLPVDGRQRRVVLTAGKEAIYDALDLDDGGRYLFSIDLGLQNFITAIDARTGAKTIDPKLVPSREEAIVVCPHAGGAKSWVPGAINPATRVLFDHSAAGGQRRPLWPDSSHQPGDAPDALDRAPARAADDGGAFDGGWARVRRLARSRAHGVRRRDRRSALEREAERRAELGPDQLRRGRQAVRRDDGRARLGSCADVSDADPRDRLAGRAQRNDLGVRARWRRATVAADSNA